MVKKLLLFIFIFAGILAQNTPIKHSALDVVSHVKDIQSIIAGYLGNNGYIYYGSLVSNGLPNNYYVSTSQHDLNLDHLQLINFEGGAYEKNTYRDDQINEAVKLLARNKSSGSKLHPEIEAYAVSEFNLVAIRCGYIELYALHQVIDNQRKLLSYTRTSVMQLIDAGKIDLPNPIQILRTKKPIISLAFSPDSSYLVAGSEHGYEIFVWKLNIQTRHTWEEVPARQNLSVIFFGLLSGLVSKLYKFVKSQPN